MRSLIQFGALGGFIHLLVAMVLAAIAAPLYQDYVIALDLQQILLSDDGGVGVLLNIIPWGFMFGTFIAYLILWCLVAARLNPDLARFPFNHHGKPFRAWMTWLLGGVLFLVSVMTVGFSSTSFNVYEPEAVGVVKWSFVLLTAAAAWVVVSPRGFGRFDSQLFGNVNRANIFRTVFLGIGFIVLFMVACQLVNLGVQTWMIVFSEALDRNSEVNAPGFVWFGVGMMVIGGIAYAVAYGLLPFFVPGNGKFRERFEHTRPARRLLAATAILVVLLMPWLYKIHFLGDKQLTDITGVSEVEPLSLAKIKLCLTSECLYAAEESPVPLLKVDKYDAYISGFSASFMDGGKVPLHPDAVPVLQRFLREHDYSVLRKSTIGNAVEIYHKLWQPVEAIRLKQQLVKEGELRNPMIIWSMLQLAWLNRAAPVNEETRQLLAGLSDETKYFIGDGSAVKLAEAWARFGDMQQANKFLMRAKSAYPDKYQQLELIPAKLTTGEISGRIVMPGEISGIRVGLFRVTLTPSKLAERKRQGKPEQKSRPEFGNSLITVTASKILSADGRFHFKNLGSGEYYLALLVPRDRLDGTDKVAAHNVPDRILLNAQHPGRDLGEIRLVPE